MENYNIVKLNTEVTMIEDLDTLIYVIEGENSAVVLDSGYGVKNLKEVVEAITNKPITVICTHGHVDHIMGTHFFSKFFLHKDDKALYHEHFKLKALVKNGIAREYNVAEQELEEWLNMHESEEMPISVGDVFDIGGNTLEVISLRGHTQGSIGILDRKHRILFSGDGIITSIWMHLQESTTLSEYLETVKSLKSYRKDFDTIYMGHRNCYKPASFIDELEEVIKEILSGCVGENYENDVANGLIYGKDDCKVVYNPERLK